MGAIRKLQRQPVKRLMGANTGLMFNGRPIMVGVRSNLEAEGVAKLFCEWIGMLSFRASQLNMNDILNAQGSILEKVEKGEHLN